MSVERSLSVRKGLFCFQIFLVFLLILVLFFPPMIGHCADENVWYVHDIITPSLENVHWVEEGGTKETPSWISDGSWYHASMSQSLVGSNDIFVSTYEQFNWSLVRSRAEYFYGAIFNSFSEFQNAVTQNPGPWLSMSWQIDTHWYGVSLDTTKVVASFDETVKTGEFWIWLHITRIPEYLVGEGNLENWLTGFDLTPVSIGSLSLWELHKEWNINGTYYNLRFEAPADVLIQHSDTFNCSIPVSRNYWGNTFKIHQIIEINMPANTEAKAAAPTDFGILQGNTATFLIFTGDTYPPLFTTLSGPPAKSLGESMWDSASLWLLSPGGWAAIASLILLSFTALRGRRIWKRNKRYHHIYNSMVTIYDMYSKDHAKLYREMDTLSRASIKMLLDDQITDEQFEKLLKRRDDLIERSEKQQTPPSPEP